MTTDEAILKLQKRRAQSTPKPGSDVSSQITNLNNNLIGAVADIADIFLAEKKKESEAGIAPIIRSFASMISKEMPTPKVDTTNMDMTMIDVRDAVKEISKSGGMSTKLQAEITRLLGAVIEVRNAVTGLSKKDMVKVSNQISLSRVETLLSELVKAYNASKTASGDKDELLTAKEILKSLKELKTSIEDSDHGGSVRVTNPEEFPVSPAKAAFKNAAGEVSDGLVDSDHHVQVDILTMPAVTVDVSAVSTSANQTNGSQKTQIVDAGGEVATVTGGKLDVNASIDTTGLATSDNQTNGSQITKLSDGTNTANVLKSDGTASGQNSQLVGGTYLSVSFSSSTVQALSSVDVGNYRYVSVQLSSAGTGGVANFQTSNNNTNWVSCSLIRSGLNTGATETSLNSANIDYGVVPGRYFRLNITGISGGTLSGTMVFSTIPGTQHTIGATVTGSTTGSGTATGALRVELPTNGTGVIATVGAVTAITNALPAGTNAIGKLAANSGVDIGDVDILSIAAGTNNIGNVGVIPRTSGGATPYKLVSAATTNATSVKGSAGQIFMITASNVNAAVRYLKLYNKASAPTVGTDVPVLTFAIPGNTAGSGTNIPVPSCGIAFETGIALALTTEATDAGSTGVAANEIVINMAYA